jgi:Zn-finger nucleic acid-binding protein
MECYKCNSGMKKKAFDGVLVDVCSVCEGMWLDGGELKMLQHHESKTIEQLRIDATRELHTEKKRLFSTRGMCPRCQQTSLTAEIVSGTELDICSQCGGIHFDWGELTKVLQASMSKGFFSFITKARATMHGA